MISNDDPMLKEISNKLGTLIKLFAMNLVKDVKTQKDQIRLLSDGGFQPKQIADILDTNSNVVSVTLSSLKKKKIEQEPKQEIKESNSNIQNETTETTPSVGIETDVG